MDNETINKYARDTLNALIAGGYLNKGIIFQDDNPVVKLDAPYLRAVENALRYYYQTDGQQENHLIVEDIK